MIFAETFIFDPSLKATSCTPSLIWALFCMVTRGDLFITTVTLASKEQYFPINRILYLPERSVSFPGVPFNCRRFFSTGLDTKSENENKSPKSNLINKDISYTYVENYLNWISIVHPYVTSIYGCNTSLFGLASRPIVALIFGNNFPGIRQKFPKQILRKIDCWKTHKTPDHKICFEFPAQHAANSLHNTLQIPCTTRCKFPAQHAANSPHNTLQVPRTTRCKFPAQHAASSLKLPTKLL